MIVRKFVETQVSIPGFHQWEGADKVKAKFLKHKHRHLFIIKAKVEVTGSDREVEFFELQNDITQFLITEETDETGLGINFGNQSCEMIAEVIAKYLIECGYKVAEISVSEDGESAGIVTIG